MADAPVILQNGYFSPLLPKIGGDISWLFKQGGFPGGKNNDTIGNTLRLQS